MQAQVPPQQVQQAPQQVQQMPQRVSRTSEEEFAASRDLAQLTALIQGASVGNNKSTKATSREERIGIGSTALNRIGLVSPLSQESFGEDLNDVLYKPNQYYEFDGKNERTNEVLSGKVAKYNENEYKKSLAVASGLLKGTIPKEKGVFMFKRDEAKKEKKKLVKTKSYDNHELWGFPE